nr:DUF1622 domain-containing protein [Peptoniphilus sp. KCTC 25270]
MDFNAAHYDFSINAGLNNALEILLAAEVLKTIAYRTTDQLLEVAALVIIRIFLTLLIHWEYRQKADHDLREHPQDVEYEYTVVEEEEEV